MKSHKKSRMRIAPILAVFFVLTVITGCGKTQKITPVELQKETVSVLEEAGFKAHPASKALRDDLKIRDYRAEAVDSGAPFLSAATAIVWYAVDDSVENIQKYYQEEYPYILEERKSPDGDIFIELSPVEDLMAAAASGITPLTTVEIRKEKLTDTKRAALKRELKDLEKRSKTDLAARRRVAQLQRILSEKPLVRVSVQQLRTEPAT